MNLLTAGELQAYLNLRRSLIAMITQLQELECRLGDVLQTIAVWRGNRTDISEKRVGVCATSQAVIAERHLQLVSADSQSNAEEFNVTKTR
jgi:hypothetical protein